MGRPKIKIIDDSIPEVVASDKSQESRKTKKAAKDDLVAKINAELGIENTETVDNRKSKIGVEDRQSKVEEKTEVKLQSSTIKKPSSTVNRPSSKAKPRSKKYQEATKELDKSKSYPLTEALDLVKKLSYSKFNGTLEAHINTAVTGIRGLISLPFASGKKLRILVFGKNASESGADRVGDENTIEEINKGKIDFDLLITTPEWMPKLAKVAKNLGPRGLMPNPKSGTITEDLKKAVESFQAGKTEYKTEAKAKVMHLALGKLDQPIEELSANVKALLQILGKTRVKKITLSPTMGPGVKVDLSSL